MLQKFVIIVNMYQKHCFQYDFAPSQKDRKASKKIGSNEH
jgi:hypothetical protein